MVWVIVAVAIAFGMPHLRVTAQQRGVVRARDLGIPFEGTPGPLDAITDVAGVEVGLVTLIEGQGALIVGEGPVRTGVTAILPRGKHSDPVFAAWYSLNGNGEMTGTTWVDESGFLEGPVMITNTHSVGVVRDAVIDWTLQRELFDPISADAYWGLPVVAETYDGFLNDINGFHVKPRHVFEALDGASGGAVAEGNVGGGTGMSCHGFKCGTGTASRIVEIDGNAYTLGALVQANYGGRATLRVAGAPVGQDVTDLRATRGQQGAGLASLASLMRLEGTAGRDGIGGNAGINESGEKTAEPDELGSIIVVVATDAPLLPHQLERIARRIPIGVGRMGGMGGNSSGDIFIAFSTANPGAANRRQIVNLEMLPNDRISPLFSATAFAVEEAITNALVAGETITGRDGNTVYALPHERLREVLRRYGRLAE